MACQPCSFGKILNFKMDTLAQINRLAPVLGGFFEAGGYMKMEISLIKRATKSGGTTYLTTVTPIVGYSDSNKKKLLYLKSLFGGGIHKEKNKNSARWYIKSRKIIPLIETIQKYAPSWQTFIEEFYNWSVAEDVETKVEIAKGIKRMSNPQPRDVFPIEEYRKLINMPQFLAGVFEARGALYKYIRSDSPINLPTLAIHSQNYNLLRAIKEKYGGGISNTLRKKDKSLTYVLGKHQSQKFLKEIKPYFFSS